MTIDTMRAGRHRVVVVGGGFGGLNATRELADADVDLTLVDRTNQLPRSSGRARYGASPCT